MEWVGRSSEGGWAGGWGKGSNSNHVQVEADWGGIGWDIYLWSV